MLRRLMRLCPAVLVVLPLVADGSVAWAAPPHAAVLPDDTRGHVSSLDLDRLEDHWNKTQLGRLMTDPVMEPFEKDLRRQFNEKMEQATQRLGLRWEDVRAMAGGEVSASVIRKEKGQTVLAVLVDVTGKQAEVDEHLPIIYKRLTEAGAKQRQPMRVGDTEVTVFDLAPSAGLIDDHRQSAFFVKDNLLGAVADVATAREIIARFSGDPQDNLAGRTAYRAIMDRCRAHAGDVEPDMHWFLEPIAYVEAMRAANPDYRREGTDMLKVLKHQGFAAIGGIGGFVHFNADDGRYEMLHRTHVFAPRSPQPWKLAMRMMEFPNSESFTPQPWVPRDIATYSSFHCNLQNAFERASTIFEELFCEGVEGTYEDMWEGVRTDPYGPQIDVRNELIANLGSRVSILSDYQLPITTTSERTVFAIEAKDEPKLAAAIKKTMDAEQTAEQIELEGHVVWEISEENAAVPELNIEHQLPNLGGGNQPRRRIIDPDEERFLPNKAVAVAHGHLFVATHLDILKKVLQETPPRRRLANDFDYQIVMEQLEKLNAPQNCARIFSRTDEEYRPSYELIRQGKMPEAETTLAKVLNAVLGSGKKGEIREAKIEGDQLPPYEAIRRYFGPAGLVVTTEETGWFAVGVTLNKETP